MNIADENFDLLFDFAGEWGVPSQCGLRWRQANDKTAVMLTELYKDNPGTSITSVPASLAKQICEHFQIEPEALIYVECAPNMQSKLSFYEEACYQVVFTIQEGVFTNPQWIPLSREERLQLFPDEAKN